MNCVEDKTMYVHRRGVTTIVSIIILLSSKSIKNFLPVPNWYNIRTSNVFVMLMEEDHMKSKNIEFQIY